MPEKSVPLTPLTEREIVSFERCYLDYKETVFRQLLQLTDDPVLAEELTQETFLAAMKDRHLRKYTRGSILPWLRGILYRQFLYHGRSKRRRDGVLLNVADFPELEEIPSRKASPEEILTIQDLIHRIMSSASRGTAAGLRMLLLKEIGYSNAEIAIGMGYKVDSLRQTIRRALQTVTEGQGGTFSVDEFRAWLKAFVLFSGKANMDIY